MKPYHLDRDAPPRDRIENTSHLYHKTLHPSWRLFIEYCTQLGHGEIEVLKIQDGLPVLAEVVKKKIKF